MQKNIGTTDRVIRFVLGVGLLSFAYWQSSWVALAAGLFTIYEALASWCVFYQIIGKNNCPLETQNRDEDLMLNANKLGLAAGLLWGVGLFITTNLSIHTGYAQHWLEIVGNLYPGYEISFAGSLVGLAYGFIDGFISLFLLGWLYNKL